MVNAEDLEKLIKEVSDEYFKSYYSVSFDYSIKIDNRYYMIKHYENLNSLSREVIEDLKNFQEFFSCFSIIISERTSRNIIRKDRVYVRGENILVVSPENFLNLLQEGIQPIYRYGKVVAKIDFKKLKELREKSGFSLSKLSKILKVSKKHLYEIEKGIKNPSYDLAKKLEKIFNEKIILSPLNFLNELSKEKKVEYKFNKFCSSKGLIKKHTKYLIPKDDEKAYQETLEISNFFGTKVKDLD